MGHFTPEKTEQIKQSVLQCTIQRRTINETQAYINETLHIPLSIKTIKNYRARTRLAAQSWIARLAKSKRADYIAEYKTRIDEITEVQRTLWDIIRDAKTWPSTRVEACGKLLNCTEALVQLYDAMPIVTAIRDYDSRCIYGHSHSNDRNQPDTGNNNNNFNNSDSGLPGTGGIYPR